MQLSKTLQTARARRNFWQPFSRSHTAQGRNSRQVVCLPALSVISIQDRDREQRGEWERQVCQFLFIRELQREDIFLFVEMARHSQRQYMEGKDRGWKKQNYTPQGDPKSRQYYMSCQIKIIFYHRGILGQYWVVLLQCFMGTQQHQDLLPPLIGVCIARTNIAG